MARGNRVYQHFRAGDSPPDAEVGPRTFNLPHLPTNVVSPLFRCHLLAYVTPPLGAEDIGFHYGNVDIFPVLRFVPW